VLGKLLLYDTKVFDPSHEVPALFFSAVDLTHSWNGDGLLLKDSPSENKVFVAGLMTHQGHREARQARLPKAEQRQACSQVIVPLPENVQGTNGLACMRVDAKADRIQKN